MKKGILVVVLAMMGPASFAAPPPQRPLKITVSAEGGLAIAVLDARPDVVSGERKETFIGLSRSLYGIPYPDHTTSKKPFAQELASLIARALKLGGTPAQVVAVSPYKARAGAIDALKATAAARLVLLEIQDWWSDKLIHTDLHHDLKLSILGSEGQELASSTSVGHDELGKRQRAERRDVNAATNDILSTLFSASAVVAAFSPEARPTAPKSTACTVDQVLKMKEAGLTQAQIEAACGSGR